MASQVDRNIYELPAISGNAHRYPQEVSVNQMLTNNADNCRIVVSELLNSEVSWIHSRLTATLSAFLRINITISHGIQGSIGS